MQLRGMKICNSPEECCEFKTVVVGKRYPFYSFIARDDGAVDVLLDPDPELTPIGEKRRLLILRRMPWHDALALDIRANYDAWCEEGEVIWL